MFSITSWASETQFPKLKGAPAIKLLSSSYSCFIPQKKKCLERVRESWCDHIIEIAYHVYLSKSTCLDSSQQSCPELPWAPTATPCISSISLSFAQHHCANSLGERGLALAWTRKVNGLFVRNMPSILKRQFSHKAFNHFSLLFFPETPAGNSLQHPKHRTRTILEAASVQWLLPRLPGNFWLSLCSYFPRGSSAKAVLMTLEASEVWHAVMHWHSKKVGAILLA